MFFRGKVSFCRGLFVKLLILLTKIHFFYCVLFVLLLFPFSFIFFSRLAVLGEDVPSSLIAAFALDDALERLSPNEVATADGVTFSSDGRWD